MNNEIKKPKQEYREKDINKLVYYRNQLMHDLKRVDEMLEKLIEDGSNG